VATSFKRVLVGSPKRTEQAVHERLTKKTALAVFSSDALSSTAYATQEILLVLAVAVTWAQQHGGAADAFRYVIPVSLAIAALLIIVAISYRQTIFAYPSGGGAYIVAKDNLGTYAGLTAAAALLVDYVLTVSVSISAGVSAITSAAQDTRFNWLHEHKVALGLFFIALIAVANLRGVRESGALFAAPTYAFLVSFLFMIGFGFFHYLAYGGAAPPPEELKLAEGYAPQPVTLFLLLGAFSNGCSALTGIEAISNGVPAFKKPESRNAATTLVWMALLLTVMFLGTSVMAYLYGVHPSEKETVISQFARIMFTGPMGWFYYVVQAATTAILVLAANTSFADFPRLSSLLARDRYLPRQFANRGDRLVFSNGIVILSIFSGILVAAFGADENRLIPLYAVGVFLSFTLSQSGMVVHWLRERAQLKRAAAATKAAGVNLSSGAQATPRAGQTSAGRASSRGAASSPDTTRGVAVPDPGIAVAGIHASQDALRALEGSAARALHWRKSIVINALGALATLVVLVVFVTTKFVHGAWIVVALIPVLVLFFRSIHEHYASVARQLTTEGLEKPRNIRHTVVVPISGIHRGVIGALEYAKAISGGNVRAVYVDIDEEATRKLREKWEQWGAGVKLVVLPSPYRSLIRPLLRYLNRVRRRGNVEIITVVLPEFVPARWWQHLLHNQSSLLLKGALLFRRGIIVTSVPYHLEK
jgi:amino acid transporter